MALFVNMLLFFLVYMPLTLLVAWPGDFYVGQYQAAEDALPLVYWILLGWPILFPSLAFVPIADWIMRLLRRFWPGLSRSALRKLSIVIYPTGLLAVHLIIWGTLVFSLPLLVSILVPGAIYGAMAWLPRRKDPQNLVVQTAELA